MTFSWDELNQWSEQYGIDIDAMLEALGEPDENDSWTFPDESGNGIPDILDGLITDPIVTNPSQGGAWG